MATVFIIDDDNSVLKSLSRLLRSEGIQTECFESARSYLERDSYNGVGCILLDINMPEVSGIAGHGHPKASRGLGLRRFLDRLRPQTALP